LEEAERSLAPGQDGNDEETDALFERARSLQQEAEELRGEARRLAQADGPSAGLVHQVELHNTKTDDFLDKAVRFVEALAKAVATVLAPAQDHVLSADLVIGELEKDGSDEAKTLASELKALRSRLAQLIEEAESLSGSEFSPTVAARILHHNRETKAVLAELDRVARESSELLASKEKPAEPRPPVEPSPLPLEPSPSPQPPVIPSPTPPGEPTPSIKPQPPVRPQPAQEDPEKIAEAFRKIAQDLVDSGKYSMTVAGESQCNVFLHAFAKKAVGYEGFGGLRANEIARCLRNPKKYAMPFAPVEGKDLQDRLSKASDLAGAGKFVIVVWENKTKDAKGNPRHGHVAIIIKGDMTRSGSWGALVPAIAQAGMTSTYDSKKKRTLSKDHTFAGKGLNYGFSAKMKDEIEIYVYSPPKKESP
jgi:hypothetical protein